MQDRTHDDTITIGILGFGASINLQDLKKKKIWSSRKKHHLQIDHWPSLASADEIYGVVETSKMVLQIISLRRCSISIVRLCYQWQIVPALPLLKTTMDSQVLWLRTDRHQEKGCLIAMRCRWRTILRIWGWSTRTNLCWLASTVKTRTTFQALAIQISFCAVENC